MTEYEECPHGRHKGAYCEPCEEERLKLNLREEDYQTFLKMLEEEQGGDLCGTTGCPEPLLSVERQSGLNASYYDFPCTNAQELIEWLKLDFSNGNILKSLIRENNPVTKKDTNELYEAEKRYYYAHRHLRSVQKKWAVGDFDSTDVKEGLERKTKE